MKNPMSTIWILMKSALSIFWAGWKKSHEKMLRRNSTFHKPWRAEFLEAWSINNLLRLLAEVKTPPTYWQDSPLTGESEPPECANFQVVQRFLSCFCINYPFMHRFRGLCTPMRIFSRISWNFAHCIHGSIWSSLPFFLISWFNIIQILWTFDFSNSSTCRST